MQKAPMLERVSGLFSFAAAAQFSLAEIFVRLGRDQLNTHIWDTDTITDRRYPIVDRERGIVMAFVMYNEYAKARCADVVDYGLVCPPVPVDPLTLALVEAFKIRSGEIHEVAAVFAVLPGLRLRGLW